MLLWPPSYTLPPLLSSLLRIAQSIMNLPKALPREHYPILDQAVDNDQHDKVGEVEDILVAPDQSISYAIVGVGGFLGLGEHSVAIPFTQLKAAEGKFTLRGATKEALKTLPKFDYAKAK